MSSQFYKNSDGLFRCKMFEQWPWLEHGFGTRQAEPYYAAHPITTLKQIHSDTVVNARGLTDRACEGDALVTGASGKPVGVRTADCVPILMVDPKTRSAAAVHAGWRGTVARIAARAVQSLSTEFGVQTHNLYVAMGPSIRVCCYEVGPEVASQFRSILPEIASAVSVPAKIDLIEANRRILLQSDVPAERIYDSGLCTFCMPGEFFSYRRDPKDPGRLLSFIEVSDLP